MNKFPQRLRQLREARRMSRKTLGELCGLSKNIIGMYERGEKEPTLSALQAIAEYFDVSLDFLIGK